MKRAHKALVAGAVVLASLGLVVMAGQAPRAYLTPEEVQAQPDRYDDGSEIQVVAVVVPDTIRQDDDGMTRFSVQGETNATLDVVYPRGLTDAFGADKWVVVTGTLVRGDDGGLVFEASDVQVGCPSKWDAKKDEVQQAA